MSRRKLSDGHVAVQPPAAPVVVVFDATFFDKQAVRVGTAFRYAGMRDHAASWRVVRIETYKRVGAGRFKVMPTDEIQHLSDIVHLERDALTESGKKLRRHATFGGLRYSAVWRLA